MPDAIYDPELVRMLAAGQGMSPLSVAAEREARRKRLEEMMRGIMLGGRGTGVSGQSMAPMPQMGRATGARQGGGVMGIGMPFAGPQFGGPQSGYTMPDAPAMPEPKYLTEARAALERIRAAGRAQKEQPRNADPVAYRADMERMSMDQTDAARRAAREGLLARNLTSLGRMTGDVPELGNADAQRVAAAMGAPYRQESLAATGPGWSVARGVGSNWKEEADKAARAKQVADTIAAVAGLKEAGAAKRANLSPETVAMMKSAPTKEVDVKFLSDLKKNRQQAVADRAARGQAVLQQRYENSPEGRLREFMVSLAKANNPVGPAEDDSARVGLGLINAGIQMGGPQGQEMIAQGRGMLPGAAAGATNAPTPAPPVIDPTTNTLKPRQQMLNDLVSAYNNGHMTAEQVVSQAEQYDISAASMPDFSRPRGVPLATDIRRFLKPNRVVKETPQTPANYDPRPINRPLNPPLPSSMPAFFPAN